MGACFSRSETQDPSPTAKVISVNGELHEYAVPVTVSRVHHLEAAPSTSGYFICNSDGLFYDERIHPLSPGEELVGDQIYFVLTGSKRDVRLKAQEMASLAVKASLALQKAEEKGIAGGRRRRGKSSMRISPVHDKGGNYEYNTTVGMPSSYFRDDTFSNGRDIVGNKRNVARSRSSKRRKVSVTSFKMRLTTIDEGSVM